MSMNFGVPCGHNVGVSWKICFNSVQDQCGGLSLFLAPRVTPWVGLWRPFLLSQLTRCLECASEWHTVLVSSPEWCQSPRHSAACPACQRARPLSPACLVGTHFHSVPLSVHHHSGPLPSNSIVSEDLLVSVQTKILYHIMIWWFENLGQWKRSTGSCCWLTEEGNYGVASLIRYIPFG